MRPGKTEPVETTTSLKLASPDYCSRPSLQSLRAMWRCGLTRLIRSCAAPAPQAQRGRWQCSLPTRAARQPPEPESELITPTETGRVGRIFYAQLFLGRCRRRPRQHGAVLGFRFGGQPLWRGLSFRNAPGQCQRVVSYRALCHADGPGRSLARWAVWPKFFHDWWMRRLHDILLLQPANVELGAGRGVALRGAECGGEFDSVSGGGVARPRGR